MGITPWSPLGAGFLTGKYSRDTSGNVLQGGGRLDASNQPFRMFTERNWKILDTLREVSQQINKPMSQVALAWASARPGITSVILGASKLEQLESNLASLQVILTSENLERLNSATAFDPMNFYSLFQGQVNRGIFGGASVEGWSITRR